MAQLIVLDASVAIAALSAEDTHHPAAADALSRAGEAELVLAASTRAEILVGPSRTGGSALAAARDFLEGCSTVPIGASLADAAAALKAIHRALSLPDALTLALAERIDADAVWTLHRRWQSVDPRVMVP